jgi:ferredoxin-type protein NapH
VKRLVELLRKTSRWKVQIGALVVLNAYFLPWLKRIPCTALNCHACPAAIFACPIGAMQHSGTIRQVPIYVLGALGIVAILIGRLSCGWFCPFGFLQDQLYRLRTPKITIRRNVTWIRYVVLVVLVGILPVITYKLWFCRLCPAGTLEAGIPVVLTDAAVRDRIDWFFALKLGILALFLAAMVTIKRPFCRFVCPLGACYSPFNRHSFLQLEVDHESCDKCGRCREVCPVDIDISEDANSSQCIRCLECAKICPVSAVQYR